MIYVITTKAFSVPTTQNFTLFHSSSVCALLKTKYIAYIDKFDWQFNLPTRFEEWNQKTENIKVNKGLFQVVDLNSLSLMFYIKTFHFTTCRLVLPPPQHSLSVISALLKTK
jgi:hypothetical protein